MISRDPILVKTCQVIRNSPVTFQPHGFTQRGPDIDGFIENVLSSGQIWVRYRNNLNRHCFEPRGKGIRLFRSIVFYSSIDLTLPSSSTIKGLLFTDYIYEETPEFPS